MGKSTMTKPTKKDSDKKMPKSGCGGSKKM
jgi:hypothetical protein